MSLENSARTVADRLKRQEFVEVYAHHDADGIAAGSILCHAMMRAGVRFRLRIRQDIPSAELSGGDSYLLCDLGAGSDDLPCDAMVVDHHMPRFEGEFHVNPRLAGIDGDRHLSAAGTAYIVAQQMGDNRDLAGLVMPGIIGDSQEIAGMNLEIFNDAVANSIIEPGRGITLTGRDAAEQWYMATDPYLDGISGSEEAVTNLLDRAKKSSASGGTVTDLSTLLTGAILTAASSASAGSIMALYGDTYRLGREAIEDAHALTAVIDACGKEGRGDLAAALCLRSPGDLAEAWEIARRHRTSVVEAVKVIRPAEGTTNVFEVPSAAIIGHVADILVRDRAEPGAVLVYAKSGESCRISVRLPSGATAELGTLVRELAAACGGTGGGHSRRAGATIPCSAFGTFSKDWQEATSA
jgi:hypothetical protein